MIDKESMNSMMIPGELTDPKKRKGLGFRSSTKENAAFDKGLSVLVAKDENDIEEQQSLTVKRPEPAMANSGSAESEDEASGSTKQDYRQAYLDKKRLLESEQLGKSSAAKLKQQKDVQEKQEIMQRSRARDLTGQISHWRRQEGLGEYDSGTIQGNISNLERELNSIDPKYR